MRLCTCPRPESRGDRRAPDSQTSDHRSIGTCSRPSFGPFANRSLADGTRRGELATHNHLLSWNQTKEPNWGTSRTMRTPKTTYLEKAPQRAVPSRLKISYSAQQVQISRVGR